MTKEYNKEEDYESYLSDSCLQDFLRIIKRTKPATKEENRKMFSQYKQGDLSIKDVIIEKNLSLVVSVALKTGKNQTSEEKLEYIQSGIIGLIEAVDKFDLSIGTAFSTHAEYWIQMRINRYRYNNQRLIRRPEYLETILNKYRNLIRETEKTGQPLPPRNEICTILNITEQTLKRVEEDYKLDTVSLETPLNSDEQDSDDLSGVIGVEETGFDNLLDKIVLEEILRTLKINLTPYEYFVIYNRIFASETKSLSEIGNYFGITREAVRLTEERTKSKIQTFFDNNHTLRRKYVNEIKRQYPFEQIKTTPCPIENYSMYFFLRDRFLKKDQVILKELLLGNINFITQIVASEINENEDYVSKKSSEIQELIRKAASGIHFKLFHYNLLKKYKNKIYRLDLDSDLTECFNIKQIINDYWHEKDPEEVISLISSYNLSCKEELIELIKRYYGIAPQSKVQYNKDRIERDVNYSLYGFAIHEISSSHLYPYFLANQDKFTEKQRILLNAIVFKKEKLPSDFPPSLIYNIESVLNKLILLSHNIEDYKSDNFSTEKYLSIRQRCIKNIDSRGIKLLDLYYGINGSKLTIRKIAELLREDALEVEKDFRRAKSNAISIYLGTTQYSYEKDKIIYRRVLEDDNFTLGSPHIEVAKMFFIEGKSYEQIAFEYDSEPKFTQRKVSELIKYACSAMDYYRLGITSTRKKYSSEFLSEVLNTSTYDEETKKILRTYIANRSSVITANIFQRDLEEVRNIIRKLSALANKIAIEQVEITKEDVEAAVLEHDSTNILNERERIMLSLTYGLENKYNPSGKKRYPIDIGEIVGIKNNIGTAIRKAKEHVAAHKIGLLKSAIDFINRKTLESAIRDPRLPLTDEDKNIIIDAYGLYDTKYLTVLEIGEKYNLKDPIARKRLYKGIIIIKKYLNNEIEGKTLFDIDIEPYLKYFILEDREILTALYRDNKTQVEIEKDYNLSTHQFNTLMQKIRMHLSDLRSGKASGIDFDYFWSNVAENDIPFYGNKQLAIELCFLYYEKRLTQSDIIKYNHPELGETSVSEIIKSFTTAVIKHQNGIRKANEFSFEEVVDYYNRHKDEFGIVSTKIYRNYFSKIKRNGPFAKIRPNKYIAFDLIKEKYPDYFKLKNATPEQVKEILENCGHTIPKDTIKIIESIFGVTHANLLSEEEWEHIINILGPLQLVSLEENQSKAIETTQKFLKKTMPSVKK